MISFDEKYAIIHKEIQKDADLVKRIYTLAREKGLRNKDDVISLGEGIKGPPQIYFPCGKMYDIYLGLDLNEKHLKHNRFFFILANMRLIYEESKGEADISKVYAILDNNQGIVSEDMSCGGRYIVYDLCSDVDPIVRKLFDDEPETTTFEVQSIISARRPIVDLDHMWPSEPYKDRMLGYIQEYIDRYESDKLFRIREYKQ